MNAVGFGIASVLMAHILADFYAQSDGVAKRKAKSPKTLFWHCALYALVFGACVLLLLGGSAVAPVILMGILAHACIDCGKYLLGKRISLDKLKVFCADQAIHIAILVLAVVTCSDGLKWSCLAMGAVAAFGTKAWANGMALAFAFLIVGKPTSIFVSFVLSTVEGSNAHEGGSGCESTSALKAGRWIGVLERVIVVVMTLWNEFGAIAFVLTAKSIARFDLLKERSFAERYLVGTLASVAVAILVALMARALLL